MFPVCLQAVTKATGPSKEGEEAAAAAAEGDAEGGKENRKETDLKEKDLKEKDLKEKWWDPWSPDIMEYRVRRESRRTRRPVVTSTLLLKQSVPPVDVVLGPDSLSTRNIIRFSEKGRTITRQNSDSTSENLDSTNEKYDSTHHQVS
jgi:hypothetical protein